MKKKFVLGLAICSLLVLAVGCASGSGSSSAPSTPSQGEKATGTSAEPAAKPLDLVFANGRPGGSQYPISVALTQVMERLPEINTTTIQPGGGAANVVAVDEGQAHLAITLALSAVDGVLGNPPYKKKTENMTELFALHPFNMVIYVGKDSDIMTVSDLVGKRVNVGPSGFTSAVLANMLFDLYGLDKSKISIENLEITDAIEQFKDKHLDAFIYTPSDRYGAFMDLTQTRDMRLLQLEDDKLQELLKKNPSFYLRKYPVSDDIYRGVNQVTTIAYANNIIANKDTISEDLGYKIVKTVAENFAEIQAVEPSLQAISPKDFALDVGIPFHPGALKYFKEQGWK